MWGDAAIKNSIIEFFIILLKRKPKAKIPMLNLTEFQFNKYRDRFRSDAIDLENKADLHSLSGIAT
jgi:hypothetical protein